MASALELVERALAARHGDESRYAADQWISDYLIPSSFQFGGHQYPFGGGNGLVTTYGPGKILEISATLPSYTAALRACPPAFAAQMVRAAVLSGARFTFRNRLSTSTPRRQFGSRALNRLEQPWPKATTGQMISICEWHAGLAGNAYVVRQPERLRVLRPDWVGVLYGSQQEPDDAAYALDGELIGYVYQNGGLFTGRYKPHTLLPDDVAHWVPLPDPLCAGIGMSWLTPALRDIQADAATTDFKIAYWRNSATPNLVVKGISAATKEQFQGIVDMLEQQHTGAANAFKTLYLTAGADATVIGSNLAELDLKNVQGAGETRISMLSRVPATILQIAEGLAGSSLNAGNFSAARRTWADSWIYPTLSDLAATFADIVEVPPDAELWTDTADMPILREDAKDAAEIAQINAQTVVALVNGGWTPESAKAYATSGDISQLKHTGLLSVQLQPPGAAPPATAGGVGPKAPPAGERKYNPAEPRIPSGGPHGGEWGHGGGALEKAVEKIAGEVEGKSALKAATAKLPDRVPGVLDTDAQLSFTHDPGWSEHVGQGTSRAVRLYRNSTFKQINGYLRDPENHDPYIDIRESVGGKPKREHILYDHVVLIDQAMEEAPLSKPVLLHRGIGDGHASFGDAWNSDMTGAEWHELGFVSSSADPAVARVFASDAILRLHVAKGVGAIQLDGWKSEEHFGGEAELLLQRDLRMRVIKDTPGSGGFELIGGKWVDTGPKVFRTLDVMVEPIPEDEL